MLQARQPNSDKPHGPRLEVRPVERGTCRAKDNLTLVSRTRATYLVADQLEVRQLQLDRDSSRSDAVCLETLGDSAHEVAERFLQVAAVGHVILKSRLGADCSGGSGALDRRAVAPLCKALKKRPGGAKRLDQLVRLLVGKVADGADSHQVQLLLGLGPQPRNYSDRERGQEVGLGPGLNQDQT